MSLRKVATDLPKSVKVGWRDYKIVDWEPRAASASKRYGECSHLECEIRIDMTYGTRQAASTLLHEIMHAVCSLWNYEKVNEEEKVVSALGDGLSTVWRDNPTVMEWIGINIMSGT